MKLGRVGSAPVSIPNFVSVEISDDRLVFVARGESHVFVFPKGLTCCLRGDQLFVSPRISGEDSATLRSKGSKRLAMLSGLCRSNLTNLVGGLISPFIKRMNIVGVGYRANLNDPGYLTVSIGYSHLIKYKIPNGVSISCPKQTDIVVESSDKQKLGVVVSDICKFRKYDPYKGKGIILAGKKMLRKEASKK